MDVVWDDNGDLIDLVMMLFFTPGGDFTPENEVLHHVEDEGQPVVWGGSRPGKAPNLERHRVMYSHSLHDDFWGPSPVFNAMYFKKLFKLPIGLLMRLLIGLFCKMPILTRRWMQLENSVSQHCRRCVLLFVF
jgi:hypothetical protein